jgi:kumamolisin
MYSSYITSLVAEPSFVNINDTGWLTPPQVASAYNIPAGTGANVKVGIISLGGGWSAADFNKSMGNLNLSSLVTGANITTVLVDGASGTFTGSSPDDENTLDLYCVAGMAPKANIVIYIGQNSTASFANVVNRAVNENCDIITISWGTTESAYSASILEPGFANAAAKGITVCVATGDYGSQPISGANIVGVQYPATSSNVVAVGGTQLSINPGAGNVRINETVEYNEAGYPAGWGGGGGVSSIIARPSWQANLTYQQYFKANSTAGPVTTLTTRGIPDIAAAMNGYALWYNSTVTQFGGTSASAPVMAGMFARFMSLNGGRRPVPNAIHPILYANLAAYYDITTGNNATVQYLNGYAASSNWDPVTGVGVPFGNVVNQMVTSGGTQIKTAANTWNYVANVQVKTGATTWSNVKSIWTKTINGWTQTF